MESLRPTYGFSRNRFLRVRIPKGGAGEGASVVELRSCPIRLQFFMPPKKAKNQTPPSNTRIATALWRKSVIVDAEPLAQRAIFGAAVVCVSEVSQASRRREGFFYDALLRSFSFRRC